MSLDDAHLKALEFARQKIESWKTVTQSQSSIIQLKGNSNKVYLLQTTSDTIPQNLIYRQFGSDTITSKTRERAIFSYLSSQSFGPTNFGDTETERLEEYYSGFEPIKNFEFHDPILIPKISSKLKEFHSIPHPTFLPSTNILLENLSKWRQQILSKLNLYSESQSLVSEATSQETLNEFYSILPQDSVQVFSHLDPSPMNFLYNQSLDSVKFVDFEFAGLSFRSLDLALMLIECQKDYYYEFPPFFRIVEELAPNEQIVKKYVLAYGEGREMWVEVMRSLVVVNLVWSLWSFAVYEGVTDGYDYLLNGITRFRMFKDEVKRFWQNGGFEYLEETSRKIFVD